MANPSKRKGTDAENAVVEYLRRQGWTGAERRAPSGMNDKGDITGVPGLVIEVKNHKEIKLAEWITELQAECRNAGVEGGWLVVKRRGKSDPADWYWITTGDMALNFTQEWSG